MCTNEFHCEDQPAGRPSRRSFLRAAGLVGAGTTALGLAGTLGASPAAAASQNDQDVRHSGWHPDPDSPRFTLAVMPDTQYLFDQDRIHPAPLAASFDYLIGNGGAPSDNIVFLAHLGDLTQNGLAQEFGAVTTVFDKLDRAGVAYSVLAGNHDVPGGTTDQRGDTPYLDTFGPRRFAHSPSFAGATPDGYNTFHTFRAAGRQWLVLALDWRPSAGGIAWAKQVIAAHPHSPVILTTHEIVGSYDDGTAGFSGFGQQLWDELINGSDQIFLTLNGHYWPAGRMVQANAAGHDVHLHIANYQNRYYGGAAMIRLYHFDLVRNVIDVETVAPWIMGQPAEQRNLLAAQEIELSTDIDYFSLSVDFESRFAGFAPLPQRPARPARQMLVPGTLAYWRFDGHPEGSAAGPAPDSSGHGNDLSQIQTMLGTATNALTYTTEHHPDQPGHASLRFTGGRSPIVHGTFLQTAPGVPLNAETFAHGYTFEAFFKIPADFDGNNNSWAGMVSRGGSAIDAGKTSDYPQEPLVTLSLSGDRELQWNVYPLNQTGPSTNWGHELPLNQWWHVAVVNDGQHTVLYVDGCPLVRNPSTPAIGLTTLNKHWLLGGHENAGQVDQVFNGWVGDVRIVNRPLHVDEFMNA
jgi:hypothetical protein